MAAQYPFDTPAIQETSHLHWARFALVLIGSWASYLTATPLDEQLPRAASDGTHAEVQKLLSGGADVEAKYECGTALMWASWMGHAQIAQLLIRAGAKVDATCELNGDTPLLWAIATNHADIVADLLAAGAQPDKPNGEGVMPMHRAAQMSCIGCLQPLLEFQVDPNAANGRGMTPLMIAASLGHAEMTRALLAAKAQLDARDKSGMTALMYTVITGQLGTFEILLNAGAATDLRSIHGSNALDLARKPHIGPYPFERGPAQMRENRQAMIRALQGR